MTLHLKSISKKFNKDWIVKNLNYEFNVGETYAIIGANGSGKSTLLQIIAGYILPSEGDVVMPDISASTKYNPSTRITTKSEINFSIAAPYLDLIEEMTATEFLQFHQQFKPFLQSLSIADILEAVQLKNAAHKQIRNFSSGMKQRLKLAQAFFSDTKVLLLDEPCSNLDKQGIELYHHLIKNYTANRLVVVCSNDEIEYNFCKHQLSLSDYK